MLEDLLLGQEPIRIVVNGQPRWLFDDDTEIVAIAGGDGTNDGGAGEGAGAQPGGTANPPSSAAGSGGQGADDEPFDKDRALATIKKLRENEKAAKQERAELEELRKKVKAAEDANLTEVERLKKEASESATRVQQLEAQLREQRVASAVMSASHKLSVVDPDVAHRLLDSSAIEFDADGQPTNVEKLLEKLLEAKPYLKGTGANGSATNGAPRGTPNSPKPAGAQTGAEATKNAREALISSSPGRYSL